VLSSPSKLAAACFFCLLRGSALSLSDDRFLPLLTGSILLFLTISVLVLFEGSGLLFLTGAALGFGGMGWLDGGSSLSFRSLSYSSILAIIL